MSPGLAGGPLTTGQPEKSYQMTSALNVYAVMIKGSQLHFQDYSNEALFNLNSSNMWKDCGHFAVISEFKHAWS